MLCEDDLYELIDDKVRAHLAAKFKNYQRDELLACIKELLKYLYLSSKYPILSQKFIPVSQEVDNFWHALILQTRSYQKLCNKLPGQRMLHHESLTFNDYQSGVQRKDLVDEVLRWLVLYVRNFGDMREDRVKYWFFVNLVKKTINISLNELNQLANNNSYFIIEEPLLLQEKAVA